MRSIAIWGKGKNGRKLAALLAKMGCDYFFVDSNKKECVSPIDFIRKNVQIHAYVVICVPGESEWIIKKKLLKNGMQFGDDFCDYNYFINYYICHFYYEQYGKVYAGQVTQMSTYYCSLNCKCCMASIPYLKNFHRNAEEIKNDMDELFSKIDFINIFGPNGGGEPFLYPYFTEIIEHAMRYRDKYNDILIVSNGTVLPPDRICEYISKHKNEIKICVSNYDSVPGWHNKFEKFEQKLKEYEIDFSMFNYDKWIDMGWKEVDINRSIEDKFMNCIMPCKEFYRGKLYYCLHAHLANQAFHNGEYNKDYFDFASSDNTVSKLVDFLSGDNIEGLRMCSYCKGYFGMNSNYVQVAEQLIY